MNVLSAHRDPEGVREYSLSAESRGLKVIIAGAGKAAALPGVVASMTDLPVIGVPIRTSDLGGLDSLLSMVQMPPGVPVATRGHQRGPQRRHPGREDPARRLGWRGDRASGATEEPEAMIPRYSTPEMAAIWTDEARMAAWLRGGAGGLRGLGRAGRDPRGRHGRDQGEGRASTSTGCSEIEEITQHDVIAFVSCVAENVGDASKYIHYGLTSSDVLDTGLALQLQAAGRAARRRDPRRWAASSSAGPWSTATPS